MIPNRDSRAERRKYPRYKIARQVIYGDAAKDSEIRNEGTTETIDISRGGVRIKLSRYIEVGRVLNLVIYNPHHDEPVNADAKVVWCRKNHDDTYSAGLAFTRIGWVESDRLLKPDTHERVTA